MLTALEVESLAAARGMDQEAFARLTEPYRRELQVHCYRMLGSLQDAEDLVQETLLRAWRRLETFQHNTSFRAWLYKIATNACLDALDQRPRRVLPAAAYPVSDPQVMFEPPVTEPIWLEPLPDEVWAETATSLEARYSAAESVTLAFLVALQILPPRQRAVLIMRDVLDFSAKEVADSLALTVAAANSALHRARVTLARQYHSGQHAVAALRPGDESLRNLLAQYVSAWEAADVGQLVALLKQDAVLSMPPSPSWYRGRDSIGMFMAARPFSGDGRGRWRLEPRHANAQPAFELFLRVPAAERYETVGLQVLTVAGGQIAEISLFLKPLFFARFAFGASGGQAALR
jgi:RNA polymerase sigma-70 factor (ECF subfamily)